MEKTLREPETRLSTAFSQAVCEAIECARKGQLVEHREVKALFLHLKIKTLRLMECKKRRRN